MIELSGQGSAVRYRQRIPVPISMWQPWPTFGGTPTCAQADFFADPGVSIGGARVATLICYEQLLVWPILQSALGFPKVLVAPSNGWWTSGTDITGNQTVASTAWARLFGLSLVLAFNTSAPPKPTAHRLKLAPTVGP